MATNYTPTIAAAPSYQNGTLKVSVRFATSDGSRPEFVTPYEATREKTPWKWLRMRVHADLAALNAAPPPAEDLLPAVGEVIPPPDPPPPPTPPTPEDADAADFAVKYRLLTLWQRANATLTLSAPRKTAIANMQATLSTRLEANTALIERIE